MQKAIVSLAFLVSIVGCREGKDSSMDRVVNEKGLQFSFDPSSSTLNVRLSDASAGEQIGFPTSNIGFFRKDGKTWSLNGQAIEISDSDKVRTWLLADVVVLRPGVTLTFQVSVVPGAELTVNVKDDYDAEVARYYSRHRTSMWTGSVKFAP